MGLIYIRLFTLRYLKQAQQGLHVNLRSLQVNCFFNLFVKWEMWCYILLKQIILIVYFVHGKEQCGRNVLNFWTYHFCYVYFTLVYSRGR